MHRVEWRTKFVRNHGDKICTHVVCYLNGRHITGDKGDTYTRLLINGSDTDNGLVGMIGVGANNDFFMSYWLLLVDYTCQWTTGSAAEYCAVQVSTIQKPGTMLADSMFTRLAENDSSSRIEIEYLEMIVNPYNRIRSISK